MQSFGSGFASGMAAGARTGESWINAYNSGVEGRRLEELRARQDEDYKVRQGMSAAGSEAAERGFDKNGFATVYAAREGGPGDTEGAVTKAPVMEDQRRPEQKVLDGMTAAEQFALKNKRFDLAMEAHTKSEALASQFRDKSLAEANQQYEMTGDPNVLVNHVKRFVRDGVDFDKPVVNADGTVNVSGKLADGTPFKKENLKREEVKALFDSYSDPQRAQAAAVGRRQQLEKAAIEVEIKRAGLPAQAFDAGKKVWNEQSKSWSTVPGVEYKTINGGEGEGQRLIAITYGKDGQVGSEVDVTRHVSNMANFSKAERARADDVAKGINQALDFEKSQGLGSPELSSLSLKANATASDLIAANRNSPVNMESGKIAEYAVKMARGDKSIVVQPLEVKYNGIVYGKADGFIVDGKPVYTNPQQVREIEAKILQDKQGAAAPRMPQERPTNAAGRPASQNRTPVAGETPMGSAGDGASTRRPILEQEIASETAKLAELQAMDEASYRSQYGAKAEPREAVIERTTSNLDALQREKSTLGASIDQPVSDGMSVNGRRVQGPPPVQPAAAPAAPAPAAAGPAPAAAAPPMSAAPQPAALPTPTMSGAVVPPEQRAAQMAQLTDQANRATAVLNSRAATAAQMSDARAALRDVRAKLKELGSTYTPESARLQAVILNPRSSPAEIADARATLRAIRDQSSTTASLPMSQ